MPFFNTHNRQIFYRKEGAGLLLLALPGNTATSVCHEGELQYFGKHFHVASLDFWGTGQSQRIAPFPDDWWEQCAHDAAALMEHLGYQQCLVMGTSGGAGIALLMAILHPDQVKGVIADSIVEHFPVPTLTEEVQMRQTWPAHLVEFWQWAQGDDWQQVVEADSDFLLRFENAGGDCFRSRLNEIQCPVLLTASLSDEWLPNVSEQLPAMANQIENCRLFLAKAGDHPLMWSNPNEFRDRADDFLASITTTDQYS